MLSAKRGFVIGAVLVGGLAGSGAAQGAVRAACSGTGDSCQRIISTPRAVTVTHSYHDAVTEPQNVCVNQPAGRRCVQRPAMRTRWGGTEWSATWQRPARGLWWVGQGSAPFGGVWVGSVVSPATRPRVTRIAAVRAGSESVVKSAGTLCNPTLQDRRYYVEHLLFGADRKQSEFVAQFRTIGPGRCAVTRADIADGSEKGFPTPVRLTMTVRDTRSGQVAVRTVRVGG